MLLILIEICHFRLCKSIYLCIRVKWSNQNGSVLGNIRTKRLFVSKFAFGVMSKFPNYEAFLTCRIWADVAKPLMEYQILNKAFSLDQHPHVICLKLFRNAAQLTLWSRIDYQNIRLQFWFWNNLTCISMSYTKAIVIFCTVLLKWRYKNFALFVVDNCPKLLNHNWLVWYRPKKSCKYDIICWIDYLLWLA